MVGLCSGMNYFLPANESSYSREATVKNNCTLNRLCRLQGHRVQL